MTRFTGAWRGALGDRLCALLYDHPMTLDEVGEIFGVSRESIRKRLTKLGHPRRRPPGGRTPLHPYDVSLLRRLATTGLCPRYASELAGVAEGTANKLIADEWTSGVTGRPSGAGNYPETRRIAYEVENLVIVAAWRQGASIRDLAELMDTTPNSMGVRLHRLRRKGYDLPLRYEPTRRAHLARTAAKEAASP